MIYLRKLLLLALSTLLFFAVASCDSLHKAIKNTNRNIANTQYKMAMARKAADSSQAVATKSGYYADTTPIDLNQPSWLRKQINFQGKDMPFSLIISRILRNTSAIPSYQDNVQLDKPVSMNYKGNIKGALDNLAIDVDYGYTLSGNQVNWSAFVTKTIDVSFMPGASDYLLGRETSTATTMRGDVTAVTALDDSQHSSLKGTLSVWKDLEVALGNLKSKDGVISISEATTTVTIHDHPSNVRAVEDYIAHLNHEMVREVELQVKVLDISLDEEHEFGVDWNATAHMLGTDFNLAGNIADAIAPGGVGASELTQTGLTSLKIGTDNQTIIKALNTQGKLSVVTEPTVMTLNNQVAEFRFTRDTSYLAKAEQAMASQGTTSTSITPGVVTDGFTLYILPKIQDGKVFLDVSSTISKLQKLDSINNYGQKNTPVTPTGGTTPTASSLTLVTIQVPTLIQKRFNVRSVVANRTTLIIAGFKTIENQNQDADVFGISALGGKSANKNSVETIILITPVIIETER